MGYGCAEADDPYAAMVELCRRPMVYRAVIVSLSSLRLKADKFDILGVPRCMRPSRCERDPSGLQAV